jgi:hypothetical protein
MNILAELGDLDLAFVQAEKLYPPARAPAGSNPEQVWLANPGGFYTAVLTGKAAKSLRRDPRYLALARKLGLVDYWRAGGGPDFCTKGREPVCTRIHARG